MYAYIYVQTCFELKISVQPDDQSCQPCWSEAPGLFELAPPPPHYFFELCSYGLGWDL